MPPATAPSKATITPFACAAAKISLPWRASSALLAVTTCLPLAIAFRMNVRAGSMPPISSTTMSTSGCAMTISAARSGANLYYEASVCGGIPIIKALREGFVANQFPAIYGIVNGTCNYI
jgi:hypothetical protein